MFAPALGARAHPLRASLHSNLMTSSISHSPLGSPKKAAGLPSSAQLLLVAACFLAACSTVDDPQPTELAAPTALAAKPAVLSAEAEPSAVPALAPDPLSQTGECSWYGPGFHGRLTANGEIFNQNQLTAAHPTLPFGSKVEVTDLDSGKKVRVRINDRGPYAKDRILDLSKAAARELGILTKGTAKVAIRLVDTNAKTWPEPRYSVQIGAYKFRDRARKRLLHLLETENLAGPFYLREPDNRSPSYRLRVGPFRGYSHAVARAKRLRENGFAGLVVEEDQRPRKQFGKTAKNDAIVRTTPPSQSEDSVVTELAINHPK